MPDEQPIDAFDPRFPDRGTEQDDVDRKRNLVQSRGPGPNPDDPKVRILRLAIPALAAAAILVIGTVFFQGLQPSGATTVVIGNVEAVRDAVAERPRRVCLNDNNPCAWITEFDGLLHAFNTNGPLPEEYGRLGVAWCPSSGWFGANSTGSRWDQHGQIAEGPSPRSLDRFTLTVENDGDVVVDFASLTAGRAEWQVEEVRPPDGPACEEIPFERDPDLDLQP